MNVHLYRCEHLEPEIAVVSMDATPSERALTVVNIDASHTAAVSGVKQLRSGALATTMARTEKGA